MVTRYAGGDELEHPISKNPNGDWVDIDDYIKLEEAAKNVLRWLEKRYLLKADLDDPYLDKCAEDIEALKNILKS